MTRALTLVAVLAAGCTPTTDQPPPTPTTTVAPPEPTTTTTTAPPPSTTATTTPSVVSVPPPPPPVAAAPVGVAAVDFWRRLADCECASGRCGGAHISFFQFSADTARKVGIDGSEPYEEQRAAAIEWARRIHPREGTSAGWPHCWRVAA